MHVGTRINSHGSSWLKIAKKWKVMHFKILTVGDFWVQNFVMSPGVWARDIKHAFCSGYVRIEPDVDRNSKFLWFLICLFVSQESTLKVKNVPLNLEDKIILWCVSVNFPFTIKLLTFLVSYSIHHVIGMIPRYFMQNINHVIDVN